MTSSALGLPKEQAKKPCMKDGLLFQSPDWKPTNALGESIRSPQIARGFFSGGG